MSMRFFTGGYFSAIRTNWTIFIYWLCQLLAYDRLVNRQRKGGVTPSIWANISYRIHSLQE